MQDWRWPTYRPRNITLEQVVYENDDPNRGGVRVKATDGKVYLDAVGGIGCLPLGHSPKRWVAALTEQMNTLASAAGPRNAIPDAMRNAIATIDPPMMAAPTARRRSARA